jgi:DNA-directed RNA polymerase II subunit RPB2
MASAAAPMADTDIKCDADGSSSGSSERKYGAVPEFGLRGDEYTEDDARTLTRACLLATGPSQQLESYETFVYDYVQDVVSATRPIEVEVERLSTDPLGTQYILQYSFGQAHFSEPCHFEREMQKPDPIFPSACRLRGLTYSMPLYVDVTRRLFRIAALPQHQRRMAVQGGAIKPVAGSAASLSTSSSSHILKSILPKRLLAGLGGGGGGDDDGRGPQSDDVDISTPALPVGAKRAMIAEKSERMFLCSIPVMVRSKFCILANATEFRLSQLGEDPLDPGGYFIIRGSERVIIIGEQGAVTHPRITVNPIDSQFPQAPALRFPSDKAREAQEKKQKAKVRREQRKKQKASGLASAARRKVKTTRAKSRSKNDDGESDADEDSTDSDEDGEDDVGDGTGVVGDAAAPQRAKRPSIWMKDQRRARVARLLSVSFAKNPIIDRLVKFELRLKTPSRHSPVLGKTIFAVMESVSCEIPLAVLMRALYPRYDRQMTDAEILECIQLPSSLRHLMDDTIREGHGFRNKVDCLRYIGVSLARTSELAQDVQKNNAGLNAVTYLSKRLFTQYSTSKEKLQHLGSLVKKLLEAPCSTDRDSVANKRFQLSGPILRDIFRCNLQIAKKESYRDLVRMLKKHNASNAMDLSLARVFRSETMTAGINLTLATGNSRKGGHSGLTGLTQVLSRFTYLSTLSNLQRIASRLPKDSKLRPPRLLHGSHWGMICPIETPDGTEIGLNKNSAIAARISTGSPPETIVSILTDLHITKLDDVAIFVDGSYGDDNHHNKTAHLNTKVFVNDVYVGVFAENESEMRYQTLVDIRRQNNPDNGGISAYTSIAYDRKFREIRIACDHGRTCYPVLVVNRVTRRLELTRAHLQGCADGTLTWKHLLSTGIVEYVDTAEMNTIMLASHPNKITPVHTHCEIHPWLILGVAGSVIPFLHCNQAPRNIFSPQMTKQGVGVPYQNINSRMDTGSHFLYYPQKPLVTTTVSTVCGSIEMPAAINAIVAIGSWEYNQEDSVILNQGSIDRGLFRSLYMRTFVETVANDREELEPPSRKTCIGTRAYTDRSAAELEPDGLPCPGQAIRPSSIVTGKTTLLGPVASATLAKAGNTQQTKQDSSHYFKEGGRGGIVDRVILTTNELGQRRAKVRIRQVRIPEMGDKFSSRHGQKGVTGLVVRQEDMPFTAQGITPDIIINPHAIPSRMTMAQLIESLTGKAACFSGKIVHGDAFTSAPQARRTAEEILQESGFAKNGSEVMYDGKTGRRFETQIFIGPVYYYRLKHMVEEKIHSRQRGARTDLVRQPVEGRKKDGGGRFGEMEKDCVISHGAAAFLRERMLLVSDVWEQHMCDLCGMDAQPTMIRAQRFVCKNCHNSTKFSKVFMPYAFKLLRQELVSMGGISLRLMPSVFSSKDDHLGADPSRLSEPEASSRLFMRFSEMNLVDSDKSASSKQAEEELVERLRVAALAEAKLPPERKALLASAREMARQRELAARAKEARDRLELDSQRARRTENEVQRLLNEASEWSAAKLKLSQNHQPAPPPPLVQPEFVFVPLPDTPIPPPLSRSSATTSLPAFPLSVIAELSAAAEHLLASTATTMRTD